MDTVQQADCREIADSELTEGLSSEEMQALYSHVESRSLRSGEILMNQDECDDRMYVIIRGELAVSKSAGGGEDQVLGRLVEGQFTGAMGCLDGKAHCATLRAIVDSEVLVIHRDQLESLIDSQPWLVYKVMRAIIRNLHGIIGQMDRYHVDFVNYISRMRGRY